jgi:hypothetical protein
MDRARFPGKADRSEMADFSAAALAPGAADLP